MTGSDEEVAVPRWPNWLGLVVDDLEAACRFHGEVIGLEAIDAGEYWVQLDMGEQRIFRVAPARSRPGAVRPNAVPARLRGR
jgi:extradiol dioxygenase family protein